MAEDPEGAAMIADGEDALARPPRLIKPGQARWLAIPPRALINNPKRILRGLVSPGDSVVDLGCGPGFFTIPLARMVGDSGHVVAVDVQQYMLDRMLARAKKQGLARRIRPLLATTGFVDVNEPADFVLAFYMMHEVMDKTALLKQVHDILRAGGHFLLVEPMGHVSKHDFQVSVRTAEETGLVSLPARYIWFSRTAYFTRFQAERAGSVTSDAIASVVRSGQG